MQIERCFLFVPGVILYLHEEWLPQWDVWVMPVVRSYLRVRAMRDGPKQTQEPSAKKQSGLLAVIFLPWYFSDSQSDHLLFLFLSHLIPCRRWTVQWHHRTHMKLWYIVAISSGQSIFVERLDEPRQNLMLRLSYLLALVACISTSLYIHHDKNPIKADESFSFVLFNFQSKNPKQ